MTRKLLILLGALTAVQLSAGAGIASDAAALPALREKAPASREDVLALFVDALLEKDLEQRCSKLLVVIEKDLNNAETPLQAFRTTFKKLEKHENILKKFNAMWERHPAHLLTMLHGGAINRACGTAASLRLKQFAPLLKLDPQKLINRPQWKKDHIFALLPLAAEAMTDAGEFDKLCSFFNKWTTSHPEYNMPAGLMLADYCYTAAARSYAAGETSRGKSLEKCFNEAVKLINTGKDKVSDRKTADGVLFFYLKFRQIMKNKAIDFARSYDKRTRSTESNLWLLSTAVECGSVADFDKAVQTVTEFNPRFDSSELRFKTLLNAGMYAEAEKALKKLPAKLHFNLGCQLLTMKRDWKALHNAVIKAIQSGTPADYRIGHILLSISEKLEDPAIFRMADKILTPHLNHPALANAVGYISAVLGQDLPRARKLLTFALSKEPENIAYIDSMAWIAFKEKRYAEAEKLITKALARINPREGIATIFEHAGDIAAAQGKSPRRYYELALKYAPFEMEFDANAVRKKKETCK